MKQNEKEINNKNNTAYVAEKLALLRSLIRGKSSLLVAFSGGLDSSVIAKVAQEELGDKAVAVTIASDTFSQRELEMAQNTAKEIGITHVVEKMSELDNEMFVTNPIDRCYHCKKKR